MLRVQVVLGAVLAAVLIFAGCSRPTDSNYATRAYDEQHAKQKMAVTPHSLNQQSKEDLLVDLKAQYFDQDWCQQPYEGVDEWLARMHEMLALNEDALRGERDDLKDLQEKQNECLEKIRYLVNQNETIKRKVANPEAVEKQSIDVETETRLPFVIHLVKEGDTLYSIAKQYYRSTAILNQIIQWNQGWIRSKDDILAGLGIVLFSEDTIDKGPGAIDHYLEQMDWGE